MVKAGFKGSGTSSKALGDAAEDRALAHLCAQGLKLVTRNYRIARGPRAAGGEIDLIMRDPQGVLVFVEVRTRRDARFGGAAASIGATKRARLVRAAGFYLMRLPSPPPCRFDVVTVEDGRLEWIQAAFDAG